MSNCIQDKQKEKHNEIMVDNIMREREQHCCLIDEETKREMVDKYKDNDCYFKKALNTILDKGPVFRDGEETFEDYLHKDMVE